jgi:hypothetical protein
MAKEKRLKKEAMDSAMWRGHSFRGAWLAHDCGYLFSRECRVCGAWVQVNLKPVANDIDIGGTAVAINCKEG